jgi:hypothetical protein
MENKDKPGSQAAPSFHSADPLREDKFGFAIGLDDNGECFEERTAAPSLEGLTSIEGIQETCFWALEILDSALNSNVSQPELEKAARMGEIIARQSTVPQRDQIEQLRIVVPKQANMATTQSVVALLRLVDTMENAVE